MSIGDGRVESHTLLANLNAVDGLCQAKLHVSSVKWFERSYGRSSLRRVLFLGGWGAEKRKSPSPSLSLTRREISCSVMKIPLADNNHGVDAGLLQRARAKCMPVLGQVSSKTKKRKN